MNNGPVDRVWQTCAVTTNTPQKINIPRDIALQLSFDHVHKIEAFLIGDRIPQANAVEPDDLDFNSLTLDKIIILNPQALGLTIKEQSLIRKFSQLGLFHNLYQKARLPGPGFSNECDKYLLELLKNSLGNNIKNKDDVVNEFVQLWNEIATLPIAQKNLGTQPFTFIPKEAPLLAYHGNFAKTVEDFSEQIVQTMLQSTPGKAIINNMRNLLLADCRVETLSLAEVFEGLKISISMTMKQVILDQPDIPHDPEVLKAHTMATSKFVEAFTNLALNDKSEHLQAFLEISGPTREEIEGPAKPYVPGYLPKFDEPTRRHTAPATESSTLTDRDFRRRDRERDQNCMQQDFKQPHSRNRNPVLP